MRGLFASVVAAFLPLAAACVLDPVDLEGKQCPCADGWYCDPATLRCMPGILLPDGAVIRDSGPSDRDGGPVDGGVAMDAPMPPPVDGGEPPADSGGVDAPMPPPDAGPPPATSCDALRGARDDILFCDGLEAADFSPWEINSSNGEQMSVTSPVHRGARAGRFDTTTVATGNRSYVQTGWTGITSGDIYYRAWFYVPSTFTATNFALFVSSESASPYNGFGVHLRESNLLTFYAGETGTNVYTTIPVPRDAWWCLQAHVRVSSSGSIDIAIDGVEAAARSGFDTQPARGYEGVGVGVAWTAGTQALPTIYVDEVAVARGAPIPCD